jgi:branched-chain amino acid transport system substrate-binding protein
MHARRLHGLGSAVVGLAAMVVAASAASAADPIRIGSFLSVTGGASFLGDPELKTLEMYIEKVNAEGGVLGRKLELIHYDVGDDVTKARTAVKRLITNDNVDIIIGGSSTGTTMAVVPLVEKEEVPFISLAGAVVIVDPVKKWVFKTPHTDRMACGAIFRDMKKRGLTQIGLLSGTDAFGSSMRTQCLEVAGANGLKIVSDETFGPKDTDMTPQLTKMRAVGGTQAVLIAGFGQGPAIANKNYRQLGIGWPLYQSHGVASKSFIELAGDSAEGVRLPAAALLVAEKLRADDPQKPVVIGYKSAYEAKFGAVSTFGGHAYDGLYMAIDAFKKVGGTDKAKVRDALEKTSGFVGTAGIVRMSASDHMGLDDAAFRMLEVRKGDWVVID